MSPLGRFFVGAGFSPPEQGPAGAGPVVTQFGLTEAVARELVLDEIRSGGSRGTRMTTAGLAGFAKLPVALRAQATTALFAWAKAYVNSPAFKTAYDALRASEKPQGRAFPNTIDEELQKTVAEQLATLEQMRQMAASMPPDQRAQVLASVKENEAKIRGADMQKMLRMSIEMDRAQQGGSDAEAMKRWETKCPADPRAMFARRLREFLDATAGVDFTARDRTVVNLSGEVVGFHLTDALAEKPWQWLDALVVGKEATAAGRAAAEAWLKEIAAA